MQKITLLGNLGKDPEEKFTSNGAKLITFSLAVTVKKGVTVWYDCNIWDKRLPMFEGILPYLKKGSRILLAGDFHVPETYQDKQGNAKLKFKVEPYLIHFAGSPSEEKPQVSKTPSSYEILDTDLGLF